MITYLGLAEKVVGIGECQIADSPLMGCACGGLETIRAVYGMRVQIIRCGGISVVVPLPEEETVQA